MNTHGLPSAPRPTIIPSQPVFANISAALLPSTMSPFPMTGMLFTRLLTSAITSRSTGGAYICLRVLPCTVIAAAPACSQSTASSGALIFSASQPARILTVIGTGETFTHCATISAASSGRFISALPPPFPATFGAGQPIFISMKSGEYFMQVSIAFAIISGTSPNIWTPAGRSASLRLSSSEDLRSFMLMPFELAISPMQPIAPNSMHSSRMDLSATPAIGASRAPLFSFSADKYNLPPPKDTQ